MTRKLVLIEGDGVGPEIANAAVKIVDAAGVPIDWKVELVGEKCFKRYGRPILESTLTTMAELGGSLKGPFEVPSAGGYSSPNYYIRRGLDLYACVRPIRSANRKINIVIVRENTEDHYAAVEWSPSVGVAEALKITTQRATERIARFAFALCRREKRTKLTIVHKANNLKLTEGLFLTTSRTVAAEFPEILVEDQLVDAAGARLVSDPESLDVVLTSNTFGDILSSVGMAVVESVGAGASANIGDGVVVTEASHGTAPDLAGRGIANPIGMIRAAAMLLDQIDHRAEAAAVDTAVEMALASGARTPDMGGTASTSEVTEEIIRLLKCTPNE